MEKSKSTYNSVDEYIALFPYEIQQILQKLRKTIKESAPEAQEKISYNMPAYKINRNLVYFAVCKNHIGFYPTPSAIVAFEKELSEYKSSKGAVQFPLNKPVPFELIEKIVQFRVLEDKKTAQCRVQKDKK